MGDISRIRVIVLIGTFVSIASSVSAMAEQFGPIRHDGGKISCDDDRGPEIRQIQTFKAPTDRFFVDGSINVSQISGWGKSSACTISDTKRKSISVNSGDRTFKVPVITEFSVLAHADCGSGTFNNSGGKTASVECSISAEMEKYTNE